MIYTPHVQALISDLVDIRNTSFGTMQGCFEANLKMYKAKSDFISGVGGLWYHLKPKRQIEVLDLILSELDAMREPFFILGDPQPLGDDNGMWEYDAWIFSYTQKFDSYKFRDTSTETYNYSEANALITREEYHKLKNFFTYFIFRDLYEETWYKYLEIAGESAASKWIFDTEERESSVKYWAENSESSGIEAIIHRAKKEVPPLEWKGTGVELAALFVELDAKGYIQLPSTNNFDRTPWEKICRAIVGLFTVTTQRKCSTGEPWYNFSRNFVSRAENEKTGELEYHKLHAARSKFKHILPKT